MNIADQIGLELVPVKREQNFEVGDTVKVHYKIVEGNRERIQAYEGVVIAVNNKCGSKTFTVRRVSFDVGIERIFPLYSPRIDKIDVIRKSKVKKSKLYYLRDKKGKSAKLKEKIYVKKDSLPKAPKAAPAVQTSGEESNQD
ncbi:MAG: 50S ribosomal protein L19 [Spirochaetes bacterium]|nr:50S ribosomal protein L19 [Spirochaetota bacterium]